MDYLIDPSFQGANESLFYHLKKRTSTKTNMIFVPTVEIKV